MSPLATYSNLLWGVLAIVANLIALKLVAAHIFPSLRRSAFVRFFTERAILVAFVVSLLATLGSLAYSDVIGYAPCKLCWFQRIFMYPMVVIFGLALWKKDVAPRLTGVVLSAIGGLIAIFHYIGQLGWNPLALDCLAVGYSSSCSQNFVLQFGYVTIPMMAIAAFALIGLSLSLSLRKPVDPVQAD